MRKGDGQPFENCFYRGSNVFYVTSNSHRSSELNMGFEIKLRFRFPNLEGDPAEKDHEKREPQRKHAGSNKFLDLLGNKHKADCPQKTEKRQRHHVFPTKRHQL